MSASRQAALASAGLVLTAALWGSMIPTIKIMLAVWDAYSVSALRFVIAAVILWGALLYVEKGKPLALDARHWKLGSMIAVFATFYTLGIAYSDLVTAALLSALGPFVTTLLAWTIYREAPPKGFLVAIPFAVAGGVLASQGEGIGGGFGFRGGEIFLIICQMGWSTYTLTSQRWLKGVSQLRLTATTMIVAALLLTLFAALAMIAGVVPPLRLDPDPDALIALLWIGIFATTVGVYFWNRGVRALGAPMTSLYLNLIPVFAIAFGLMLDEKPTGLQMLGGVMVIGAVLQMQVRRLREHQGS